MDDNTKCPTFNNTVVNDIRESFDPSDRALDAAKAAIWKLGLTGTVWGYLATMNPTTLVVGGIILLL